MTLVITVRCRRLDRNKLLALAVLIEQQLVRLPPVTVLHAQVGCTALVVLPMVLIVQLATTAQPLLCSQYLAPEVLMAMPSSKLLSLVV